MNADDDVIVTVIEAVTEADEGRRIYGRVASMLLDLAGPERLVFSAHDERLHVRVMRRLTAAPKGAA